MTSKEALKELYNIACVQPGPVKEQFITYEKEIKHNKTTEDLYAIIKQGLERLEKLEKDYEKLKERYKHRAETSNDLCKAVKQYEKAIEIICEYMYVNDGRTLFIAIDCMKYEEKEFLIEVLEIEVLDHESNNTKI